MIKEETRFVSSTVFEGMTSIRALLDNLKNNVENARKIEKIIFDKDKVKSKEKDYKYLTKMATEFDFEVSISSILSLACFISSAECRKSGS